MRGFIIKEFYHIFRDVRTMIILFGMPVVQILLFGFALTNEIKDAGIAVLDKSKDDVTTEIISKLVASDYFKLVDNIETESQIEENLQWWPRSVCYAPATCLLARLVLHMWAETKSRRDM